MQSEFVLLDDARLPLAKRGSHYFFGNNEHFICFDPCSVVSTLRKMEAARLTGRYLVGFISYEALFSFFPHALTRSNHKKSSSEFPLLHFIAFDSYQYLTGSEVKARLVEKQAGRSVEAFFYNKRLVTDFNEYKDQFSKVQRYIKQGYTYQVNLTSKVKFSYQGNATELYQLLRAQQRVHYSALLNLNQYQILSLSPELFFEKKGSVIKVKPMKGTMPRGKNEKKDAEKKTWLRTDKKQLAENVMIVDLMRNDLNRLCDPGSVEVESLFKVETYETVHQMVSMISGQVDEDIPFVDLLNALFPCGSITGAPKIETMRIIHELEKSERRIYTGSIGYIAPNNDMCFNVAIRTLLLQGGRGEMGVGGGVVSDSKCVDEFNEMKLKAHFLNNVDKAFKLIECFRYEGGSGFQFIDQHLARLACSAKQFGFLIDLNKIKIRLDQYARQINQSRCYKVRLELESSGAFEIHFSDVSSQGIATIKKVAVCTDEHSNSQNVLFQHKTTAESVRGFYNRVHDRFKKMGFDEVILMNERSEITEGTKTNVFIVERGRWTTPPIECGVLPGVRREHVIQEKKAVEKAFDLKTLRSADEVWMSNSVIGLERVKVVEYEACFTD